MDTLSPVTQKVRRRQPDPAGRRARILDDHAHMARLDSHGNFGSDGEDSDFQRINGCR